MLLVIFCPLASQAMSLEQQRIQYEQAKKALRAGNIKKFNELADGIRDYVLYPYLQYNYLRTRLAKASSEEIAGFINTYPDFPETDSLRTKWLKKLARNRDWQTFYDNYTTQDDPTLQCNDLIARMALHKDALLLEDIRSVWLSGSSLPPDCDPAFKLLEKSDLMKNDLVWQRIELAMNKGNTGLVRSLLRLLDDYYRGWAEKWIKVHNSPEKYTKSPDFADSTLAREVLLYGIHRLARININKAIDNWQSLQERYNFLPGERAETDKIIAVYAARKKNPKTVELMDEVVPYQVDDEVLHWRIIIALKNRNWRKLAQWTEGIPADEDLKYRWFYWHARALEQLGETEKAKRIYKSIASSREYYGFLAADRLGIKYNMGHVPLPKDPVEQNKIRTMPGIERAAELRAIGKKYDARREWNNSLRYMTSYQKEIAATLATDWGWHDLAIVSLGSARSYNDLEIRFPIPYESLISKNAHKRQLDPGWVYALVRSESAFIEDIKSPAGALGLMQVMPQTGRETARQLGWKHFHTNDLLDADKNVPIGSTYLKNMLDRFNGNMTLATAAYNAGPQRVKSWLPKSGCMDSDIWVEEIPFDETRTYVSRVMFFASIYDWRLHRKAMPLHQRMADVPSDGKTSLLSMSCNATEVSYN